MRKLKNIAITGGAGFIGSNLIHYIFSNSDFKGRIINLDRLTYAGNLMNLSCIEEEFGQKRYFFEKVDICEYEDVYDVLKKYEIDTIIHLAAESHVDRSINNPGEFIKTNIIGTYNLLEAARSCWADSFDGKLFHHVSTDEVYGSLGENGLFTESTAYDPRSPYSASKASSDHLVSAYSSTYKMPVTMSNCSNNYGPYQFPEKLIPLVLLNILEGKALPIYGDGKNIRDWLYVEDHCSAIWTIVNDGVDGGSYNVGGNNEWENIRLVEKICEIVAEIHGKDTDQYKSLITFVKDRQGHDRRYAIDSSKIESELNWSRSITDFEDGLRKTILWYLDNTGWIDSVKSGEYQDWLDTCYNKR